MTREVAEKIARGIIDKIECNTADIDDWAEFWGFTREEYEEFLDMAIKALEQEPFINKPCVSSEVCEHDKNVVLDKIRAEIKALTSNRGFLSCSVDHIHEKIDAVFDKYKSESEE